MAPALGEKDNVKQDTKEGEEKPNPFLNPNPALIVKELDNHIMLLNKFAVSPNHLLIVTKGKLLFCLASTNILNKTAMSRIQKADWTYFTWWALRGIQNHQGFRFFSAHACILQLWTQLGC